MPCRETRAWLLHHGRGGRCPDGSAGPDCDVCAESRTRTRPPRKITSSIVARELFSVPATSSEIASGRNASVTVSPERHSRIASIPVSGWLSTVTRPVAGSTTVADSRFSVPINAATVQRKRSRVGSIISSFAVPDMNAYSYPRMIATGTFSTLPITSSAALATSSATASTVTRKSLP